MREQGRHDERCDGEAHQAHNLSLHLHPSFFLSPPLSLTVSGRVGDDGICHKRLVGVLGVSQHAGAPRRVEDLLDL